MQYNESLNLEKIKICLQHLGNVNKNMRQEAVEFISNCEKHKEFPYLQLQIFKENNNKGKAEINRIIDANKKAPSHEISKLFMKPNRENENATPNPKKEV